MKFEFILKVKYHSSDSWTQIGKSIVKEVDFNNAQKDFEKYRKRGQYFDTIVLINELDDEGNFVQTIQ